MPGGVRPEAVSVSIRQSADGSEVRDVRGWQRLERFEAATAYPTFGSAAEALGLHVTTLQYHINRLERELGSELLVRAQRGQPMMLTAFGTTVASAIAQARAGESHSARLAGQLEELASV